ncbi:MAG: SPFH domain-containing protein [Candidatus Woesearchaeota archaeon]
MEIIILIVFILLIIYLAFGFRFFNHYQRGVVYTLGKQTRTIGPGISLIFPLIEKLTYVKVKQRSVDLKDLEVSIIDCKVQIKSAAFIKIVEPAKTLDVEDIDTIIVQTVRSAIKVVIGQKDSEYILKNGSKLLEEIKKSVVDKLKEFGVEISAIKVYDFKVSNIKPSTKNTNKAAKKTKKTVLKTKNTPNKNKSEEKPLKEEVKVEVDDEFLLD